MEKILIIDDREDNLIAASSLLKNLIPGSIVLLADSAQTGIETAVEERPDVILLDIKMPDIDGYEACRLLKERPESRDIPVIMLTAMQTTAEERIKGLELGADAFLSKPIDESELAARVKVMLRIKKAEDALRKERDELKRRAKELENFAYTVSHDLKAPLLNLGGYCSLLLKRYNDSLDEKGRHYLDVLQKNVVRMEEFIKDLLELSRIGRVLGRLQKIDMDEIVTESIDELHARLNHNSRIRVSVKRPLPVSYGDRDRVKTVFINLIDNAAKFIGDQEEPVIEIGFKKTKGKYNLFYVKDNGIGIDTDNHEKVFQEFHRLNDIETEGTGIGLAIVKKIIENHNCKIWLDSKAGVGSTFYFTLPGIHEEDKS